MNDSNEPDKNIPLVDLRAQYLAIKAEIDSAMRDVVDDVAFVGGAHVQRFERAFAEYCGVKECVGVGNGTDALFLALRALGVGEGDEVITVAHTFIATAEAIVQAGATPVFVDILPETMLMDPANIERAIWKRTKAIVPVHLYGQVADMDAILDIARANRLPVVEDAAQAHGARRGARRAGSFGDLGCFSFYPGKNLGAYGDGGAVVGSSGALLERVRMMANHGRREKYVHEIVGVNSRLDGLQAAILSVKLRYLDDWNAKRRMLAARYIGGLEGLVGLNLPGVSRFSEPVWHLFAARVTKRDELRRLLEDEGITTGVHYPLPLHRQPALAGKFRTCGTLKNTEAAAQAVISLPMYPELSDASTERIIRALRRHLRAKAS